jgi:hypothetical protein
MDSSIGRSFMVPSMLNYSKNSLKTKLFHVAILILVHGQLLSWIMLQFIHERYLSIVTFDIIILSQSDSDY